jgi:hypothetical protein
VATKIGTINFTVDADTKGLQKALGVLKDFEKANNRVARSQSKAAKSEIAARARQEQAIRKALQKTLELRRATEGWRSSGTDCSHYKSIPSAN